MDKNAKKSAKKKLLTEEEKKLRRKAANQKYREKVKRLNEVRSDNASGDPICYNEGDYFRSGVNCETNPPMVVHVYKSRLYKIIEHKDGTIEKFYK